MARHRVEYDQVFLGVTVPTPVNHVGEKREGPARDRCSRGLLDATAVTNHARLHRGAERNRVPGEAIGAGQPTHQPRSMERLVVAPSHQVAPYGRMKENAVRSSGRSRARLCAGKVHDDDFAWPSDHLGQIRFAAGDDLLSGLHPARPVTRLRMRQLVH